MWTITTLLLFVLICSFLGFYIITRKVFAGGDKRKAAGLAGLVTAVFFVWLLSLLFGTIL